MSREMTLLAIVGIAVAVVFVPMGLALIVGVVRDWRWRIADDNRRLGTEEE